MYNAVWKVHDMSKDNKFNAIIPCYEVDLTGTDAVIYATKKQTI